MARIKYKEAIGEKVRKGKPSIGKRPEISELKRLYLTELKSIREIANDLGCSKDMVHRTLQEYGIELRPGYNRSKLRKYRLSDLKKGVKDKGVRDFANELGMHENTLRYYLRNAKKGK